MGGGGRQSDSHFKVSAKLQACVLGRVMRHNKSISHAGSTSFS